MTLSELVYGPVCSTLSPMARRDEIEQQIRDADEMRTLCGQLQEDLASAEAERDLLCKALGDLLEAIAQQPAAAPAQPAELRVGDLTLSLGRGPGPAVPARDRVVFDSIVRAAWAAFEGGL